MRTPSLGLLLSLLAVLLLAGPTPAAIAQAPDEGWPGDDAGQVDERPEDDELWPEDDEEDAVGALLPDPLESLLPEGDDVPEVIVPRTTKGSVPGRVAMMRTNGQAAIPRGAPKRVRQIIAAANRIVGKPYKWGGGHTRLEDKGYDCSGAVSYALIRSGLLRSPLVSGAFAKRYAGGPGRHVTIYANKGHVYMEVAGLRLDTSAVGDRGGRKGVRWRPVIGKRRGFSPRHPVGL